MPLNVLVVGGGSIGERHLRCFQQVGADGATLCEANDARRTEVAERYGVRSFATLDEAAKHAWDAAVICTPAHLHVDHAVTLLQRTPALLIEKPLATRIEDIPRLRTAAETKIVQVAYLFRLHPAVQAIRELLSSGKLGDLLQVTLVSGQHFPTFRPAYREIYYARRESGGGAVQDAATHWFDVVQHLAGRFDWVFCDYGHQCLEGVDVEDTVHLLARSAGGRTMISISLNQFMPPNEAHLQLNGSRGSARIHLHEHRYGVICHGDAGWTWSEPLLVERDDFFRLQARYFLDVAAGRKPIVCTLDDALHTLRINLAALESAGQRRVEIQQ